MIKRHLTGFCTVMFGGAMVCGSSNIQAQTLAVEYTTEAQTDFKGRYDWLNLLTASLRVPVGRGFTLEAATISASRLGRCPLADDLLTYSNIEAGNILLTLSRAGVGWSRGGTDIFAGINNVNEDYFTSELTGLFANSSCGISPTISCNYDIANYPLAAWGLHYSQRLGSVGLQTSLYPGQGYRRLYGHHNIFGLDLNRDGLFSISSLDYRNDDFYFNLGVALHYGHTMADVEGEPRQAQASPSSAPKQFSASPWMLTEINLPHDLGLLVHGSVSTVDDGCQAYGGVGMAYNAERVKPGVSFNYARFTDTREWAVELTARVDLVANHLALQPSLHLVRTGSDPVAPVATLRLAASF